MSRRTRFLLVALSLLVLAVAVAALVYAGLPNPTQGGVYPLPAELLVPPGGAP